MARPNSGKIEESHRKDGTVAYSTRLMVGGERRTVKLGDERDGTTRLMARRRLAQVLEEIRLGTWKPEDRRDRSAAATGEAEPAFAEVAARFLAHKRSSQLRDRTIDYLRWALEVHLVPYFGRKRPSRITAGDVVDYSDHQVAQRDRIARLRGRGRYLAGPRGGALRELSNASINDTLRVLAELLSWAAAKGWGEPDGNPAAGWRLKERPRLTAALEPDELADLIAAVATPRPARRQSAAAAARAELIVRLRDEERLSWRAVAGRAGVGETTAMYHYRQRREGGRFAVDHARALADEAFVTALARTGLRVTELCRLDVCDVDVAHGKLRVTDAKTEAGFREVDMTAGLVRVVAGYFKRRGHPPRNAPAFPDSGGTRRNKEQASKQVLAPAVRLANELRAERGAPELPPVTPHVLRHTYITLAFEAGYSVPYVMHQVGHADPRTTMRIYAKVCARRDRREQGAAFDRLLDEGVETATVASAAEERALVVA